MIVTARTMLGVGVVVTAIVAPLLARWIAGRCGGRARGWAVVAAITIVAAVAPWALVCVGLAWVPPLESERREVERVRAPSHELLDSLDWVSHAADCERQASDDDGDPRERMSPHDRYYEGGYSIWCSFARFEYHYSGSRGGRESGSSRHAEWACERCVSRNLGGDMLEAQDLHLRASRDGNFAEFTCARTRRPLRFAWVTQSECTAASANLTPLYLLNRPLPLREVALRDGRLALRYRVPLAASVAALAVLAAHLLSGSESAQSLYGAHHAYRNAAPTTAAASPALAQRRLLLTTSLLFGAIAAASWFVLLRALG